MSAYPRWLELELAVTEDLPLQTSAAALPPPTQHDPKENEMSDAKECSTCGSSIGANNRSGICTPCQRKPGGRPVPERMRSDADDEVLERVEASSPKPPPPPKKPKKEKTPEGPPGDVEEFFTLATALGLDAQQMLDTWCREWVEETKARALGRERFTVVGPAGTITAADDASTGATEP